MHCIASLKEKQKQKCNTLHPRAIAIFAQLAIVISAEAAGLIVTWLYNMPRVAWKRNPAQLFNQTMNYLQREEFLPVALALQIHGVLL